MRANDAEFEQSTGLPRRASGVWLSTGWFGLSLARRMVDGEVSAVGFGCASESDSEYHYWENVGTEKALMSAQQTSSRGHRYSTEMDVFHQWGRIRLV